MIIGTELSIKVLVAASATHAQLPAILVKTPPGHSWENMLLSEAARKQGGDPSLSCYGC
jgi:hypothetical protein